MFSDDLKLYLAYIIFFFLSIIFSVLINGLFLRFSKTLGVRNEESKNIIRWASTTKPSVGGFSFYIVFLFSFTAYTLISISTSDIFNKQLIGLLLASSIGFLVGLADDAYNTNPLLKFLGQLMCAVTLIVSGVMINITDYYALNALFTIFWVIGIMNSINMLDNMDGITATISGIILLSCLVILIIQGSFFSLYSFIIIGMIGAIGGFMVFNFHPSKIYMGDTGSQFLGVLLSGLGVIVLWAPEFRDIPGPAFQFKQFLFPILVFCIPIIDTTTVFIRRMIGKQSPFIGGRDHTTHHLAYLGLSDRMVLLVLSCIGLLSSSIVCSLIYFYEYIESEITLVFFAYFVILFNVMQYLYELGNKRKKILEENKKAKKAA